MSNFFDYCIWIFVRKIAYFFSFQQLYKMKLIGNAPKNYSFAPIDKNLIS